MSFPNEIRTQLKTASTVAIEEYDSRRRQKPTRKHKATKDTFS